MLTTRSTDWVRLEHALSEDINVSKTIKKYEFQSIRHPKGTYNYYTKIQLDL